MRISDLSSDVCSSDLKAGRPVAGVIRMPALGECYAGSPETGSDRDGTPLACRQGVPLDEAYLCLNEARGLMTDHPAAFERLLATGHYQRFTYDCYPYAQRSEEHTSELQSLMRISYAVFCLKKKNKK